MSTLNIESRQSIFYGVHFLLAANWIADSKKLLDFQKSLLEEGLEFSETAAGTRSLTLSRKDSSPLQVKIGAIGPQVSEIRISTPERPSYTLELFCQEAEAVCQAYTKTWAAPQFQLLQSDAAIRHLYSCDCHAFEYLWEHRLGQQSSDFQYLDGRPVLGGGLRLVLPRTQELKDNVEIKIESFLNESQKLFIETLFVWPEPQVVSNAQEFSAAKRLQVVDAFACNQVCKFVLKKSDKEDK